MQAFNGTPRVSATVCHVSNTTAVISLPRWRRAVRPIGKALEKLPEEWLCSLCIPLPLDQNVEPHTVLIYGAPQIRRRSRRLKGQ